MRVLSAKTSPTCDAVKSVDEYQKNGTPEYSDNHCQTGVKYTYIYIYLYLNMSSGLLGLSSSWFRPENLAGLSAIA
jgi:hypothetical protein